MKETLIIILKWFNDHKVISGFVMTVIGVFMAIWLTITKAFKKFWKWLKEAWKWLNEQNAISGLAVTIIGVSIGVLLAITLDAYINQLRKNEITKRNLCNVYLESAYNSNISKKILGRHTSPNSVKADVFAGRLHSNAARVAIQDDNIVSFLPLEKLSLLMGYVDGILVTNRTLDIEQGYLEAFGYRESPGLKDFTEFIREKAARVDAAIQILQREFEDYSEKGSYDFERIRQINEEIDRMADEIYLQYKPRSPNEPRPPNEPQLPK